MPSWIWSNSARVTTIPAAASAAARTRTAVSRAAAARAFASVAARFASFWLTAKDRLAASSDSSARRTSASPFTAALNFASSFSRAVFHFPLAVILSFGVPERRYAGFA